MSLTWKIYTLSAIGLLCMVFYPCAGLCQVEVVVNTSPVGANVYIKESGALRSLGSTPLRFNTSFRSEKDAKRIYIKKIGYENTEAIISESDKKRSIILKEENIFLDPKQHTDQQLKLIQENINKRLNKLIYSGGLHPGDSDFEILGKMAVKVLQDQPYLEVNLLLGDSYRSGDFAKAGRLRNENQRYIGLVDAVLERGPGDFVYLLSREAREVDGLGGILLEVVYSKKKFVLSDEDQYYTQIRHLYSQQTIGPGGGVYIKTEISRKKTTGTVLKESKQLNVIIFRINTRTVSLHNFDEYLSNVKTNSLIYSNDNRKKELEAITYSQ